MNVREKLLSDKTNVMLVLLLKHTFRGPKYILHSWTGRRLLIPSCTSLPLSLSIL